MKKILKKKEVEKKTEREKVEERREEVLAKGRKFKYPLQYAKHRLVGVTIAVVVVALGLIGAFGYIALYQTQWDSDVLYRVTQILPISVAKIDGKDVRYSDYLMIYRSSITPIEQQQGKLGDDEDSATMRAHYKRLALSDAEKYTFAEKLGAENGIIVSNEDVDKLYAERRAIGGAERSEEAFSKILTNNFGLTEKEYRRMLYLSLMKQKVSEKIDKNALAIANEVSSKLSADSDMRKLAEEMGDKIIYEETGGLIDKMNVDGGRADMAMSLEPGQVSKMFVSSNGDGYYFVKLIEKTNTSVNYASIKVPFTEFEKLFEQAEKNDLKEYIKLESVEER